MIDFIITGVLFLFGALLAIDSFNKWRGTKSVWFIFATLFFLLAAFAMIIDWTSGFYTIILALKLRLVAGLRQKSK